MSITALAEQDPGSPFAELLSQARAAATVDVGSLHDSETLAGLSELCEVTSLVEATLARVISHAHRNETTIADCGLKVGSWIARHTNQPAGACRRRTRTARSAVEHFSESVDAVADGPMGWAHVELLVSVSNVRNREQLTAIQPELIDAARRLRFRDWAALVRRVAEQADEDGSYDPNEDTQANRLRLNALPDGTTDISGRLVGEWAHTVETTIDAIADELFRTYSRDHELDPEIAIPDRVTLRALALAEACRRARAINLDNTAPSRPEAVVIINHDETTDTTTISDRYGNLIPPTAMQRLLADATYRALHIDATGTPFDLGRRQRLITPDIRLALTVRDGGCIFAGCDAPAAWCDGHHVIAYKDGGPTDLANLALLCRHHHSLTHTNSWHMRHNTDPNTESLFEWITPTGRTLKSEHRSGAPPG